MYFGRRPRLRILIRVTHTAPGKSVPFGTLGPCAWLSLRFHLAVKRTFHSKLSNTLGTLKKGRATCPAGTIFEWPS
jgi:hypothetical protein